MEVLLPNATEVSSWLKQGESEFYHGLLRYSIERADGLGFQNGKFTGFDLCKDASFVLQRAALHRFGESTPIWIVNSKVYSKSGDFFPHFRVHMKCDDDKTYFADGVYLQVDPEGPPIAFDSTDNEPEYYGWRPDIQTSYFEETPYTPVLLGYFPYFFQDEH